MTAQEAGAVLAGVLGEAATVTESFGEVTVGVPRDRWVDAATASRDTPEVACAYFDWLTGVDDLDEGFEIFCHLWSVALRHGLLLRTRVPREDARLPSLTGVFAGASWHERETYEMFGIGFDGHPHLVPLLLPDGFEGHPLRKDFVLAARVAKLWPGAKEPGESGSGAPARRRMRPPGVPDDWGPDAAAQPMAGAGERPQRPTRDRPVRERPPRGERPPRPSGTAEEPPTEGGDG